MSPDFATVRTKIFNVALATCSPEIPGGSDARSNRRYVLDVELTLSCDVSFVFVINDRLVLRLVSSDTGASTANIVLLRAAKANARRRPYLRSGFITRSGL